MKDMRSLLDCYWSFLFINIVFLNFISKLLFIEICYVYEGLLVVFCFCKRIVESEFNKILVL